MILQETPARTEQTRRRYVPAVGPRLKLLLLVIFALFAILGVNSVYLASVTVLEWYSGLTYQNYFYQYMFLLHLVLGLLIILPVVVFGIAHIRNAYNRPNRRAVRAGLALFTTSLVLLASGVVLMRLEGVIVVKDPAVRGAAYWIHVLSPLAVVWLFILHRLAGKRIKWRVGLSWAVVAGVFAIGMTWLHAKDPRPWNRVGPKSGEKYFFPSLARTSTGDFIPAETLLNDYYCLKCHPDTHEKWSHSVHRFSSFNNPPYLFTVLNTRKVMFERDGNVNGSRFCAGCHDPVPFFSGAFDQPHFDDPNYDLKNDPMAQAGITCTVCHAVTNINSPRGNADFTIEEPAHYPFAFSDNRFLQWVNNQLVKAKPAFHKKTFLKPLHKTAEFCGACHKVHLPQELNAYKFLRGQNHYDTYHLSGVSGHGVSSFYYPPKATHNCNECHMPTMASADFGAKVLDETGELKVHNHQFPTANTAIPHLVGMPGWVNEAHRAFLDGVMRVDIFGIKEGGTIDGRLIAPLRPEVPAIEPGATYLLETVIRTLKMGHPFTQGTADSNEVWLDVTVTSGDRVIGRSGGLKPDDREVDPWSHFVNAFVVDRDGDRIDRRNAEDIFIALYDHQIPPGAADVVHYRLRVPEDVVEPITVDVKLQYRKFDTLYVKFFQGDELVTNDLPVTTLAVDRITFPIEGVSNGPSQSPEPAVAAGVLAGRGQATRSTSGEDGERLVPGVHRLEAGATSPIPAWERWNDYGIGLFRKGDAGSNKGELRQAEAAFAEVSTLGRPDGALNRARVYIKEGRLEEAVAALREAASHDPAAPPWSIAWFTGLVNKQYGRLDEAIENFRSLVAMKDTEECRRREFDFSQDYTLLIELGQTIFERAKQERGTGGTGGQAASGTPSGQAANGTREGESAGRTRREAMLTEGLGWIEKSLALDPENVTAHYNAALLYAELGDEAKAQEHRALHAKYKPDDNARDRAIARARMKYLAANHAAEAIVIYDLQRGGAYELDSPSPTRVAARASVAASVPDGRPSSPAAATEEAP